MSLTAVDRKIISTLSGDLPENLAPYEEIASRAAVSEEELFRHIERLKRSGVLRRLGAAVDHRKMGFVANAMVLWRVPEDMLEQAARVVVSYPEVSHCYQRVMLPEWPYNLYAMLHATTREQCQNKAAEISRRITSEAHTLLFSLREFKKAAPRYFGSR